MLINNEFRRLWLGQAVSLIGNAVFDTSLILWVGLVLFRGRAEAPVLSGVVLVVVAIITITVSPVAGVLVDRWDKLRLMRRVEVIRCLAVLALAVLAALPRQGIPSAAYLIAICAAVGVTTAGAQFFNPARFVVLGDIVPADQRGRAASYGQAAAAVASIAGPVVAAPLVIYAGVVWALVLNAASFAVSYAAIRGLRGQSRESGPVERFSARSMRADMLDGMRTIGAHPVLRAVFVTNFVVMLGAGALGALDIYFVAENLHADPALYGLVAGASGGGFLVGALISGFAGDRFGHARCYVVALLGAGCAFLAYSRQASLVPAILLIAVFGFAAGTLETVTGPVLLQSVRRERLGRVVATFAPAFKLASMISIAISGLVVSSLPAGTVIAAGIGRIDGVFLVTAALLLTAGVYAGTALWRQDRSPAPAVERVVEHVA
jgi:MFS family permease